MSKSKRKKLTADDNGGDKVDAHELAELLFGTIIFPTYPFRQGQKEARWRIDIPLLPNKLLGEYKRLFKLILLNRQRALTSQEWEEFNQLAILLEQRMPLTEKELDLIMQTVGFYEMDYIGKFLQQRCNVTKSELDDLSWTDILKHLTLQANLAGGKAGDSPVTLREFMREYCKGLTENLLESRVKSLQSLHQRGKIKLQHVGKWERGQSKKYLPSFLISKWPTYRKILQSLPELK